MWDEITFHVIFRMEVKVKNYYDIGGKKGFYEKSKRERFIYSDKLEHLIAVQGFDQIYVTTFITFYIQYFL